MNDEREERLARILDARVSGARPDGPTADDNETEQLVKVADLLWEAAHGAPPLEDDPVAAMLGLVPDAGRTLDAKALKRARQKAGLKTSELAERLAARGWEVKTANVHQWENRSAADVPPALIKAIAEETGVSMDALSVRHDAPDGLERIATSTRFAALVDRWAQVQRIPREMAASALKSRMLVTVHRGDRPDDDQLLQSLEALLAAVESERDNRREP